MLGEVEVALDTVLQQRPELFNFNDMAASTNWPRVLDDAAYVQAVVDAVIAQGLCARWDGEEIQVKRTNELNDQIDIHLASGHIRRGEGAYRSTCYPAAF